MENNDDDIKHEIVKLREFAKVCNSKHKHHEHNLMEHMSVQSQQDELLRTVIETQKCMSESLKIVSEFVKKHEPNLTLMENTLVTLKGIKFVIGWLAAVIGSLGVIVGGVIAVMVYSLPLTEILTTIIK